MLYLQAMDGSDWTIPCPKPSGTSLSFLLGLPRRYWKSTVTPNRRRGFIFPLLVGYDLSDENRLMSAIQSRNALINKDLRRLKETAGIRINFSYYASRHSYADIARRAGESIYDISHALGHSSIKQTENYLDRFDSPCSRWAQSTGYGEVKKQSVFLNQFIPAPLLKLRDWQKRPVEGVKPRSGAAFTPAGNACGFPKAKSRLTPSPCQPPASRRRGDTHGTDQ